ncbi:MAG TPA: hypothetical protein VFH48_38405 [Chloroflexota bacterium]|nr:hypothetical protein [Chloroflexota bacterium]
MSGTPPSAHELIRRKVLVDAYAFALSVARRPDLAATTDPAGAARPLEVGANTQGEPSDSVPKSEAALLPEHGLSDSPQVDHQGEVSR